MNIFLKIILVSVVTHLIYAVSIVAWRINVGSAQADKTKPFERILPEAHVRILVSGDSTGVGTGSETPEGSTAGQLGQLFPKAEIINRSTNGRRVSGMIPVLESLQGQHYNLIILQIGGNDILRFTPMVAIERDLASTLQMAKTLSPHVIMLHSGNMGAAPFFPQPWNIIWTARTRPVRDIYIRLAAEHGVQYVDLFQERSEDYLLKNPSQNYYRDGLHPSASGYAYWIDRITEAMRTAKISI